MGWTWKSKEIARRKTYGIVTVNRTERFMAPDRIDKISIKWFGKRTTVWERAK